MKKNKIRQIIREQIKLLTEQNSGQFIEPFNGLVPYNFSNYSGPNVTIGAASSTDSEGNSYANSNGDNWSTSLSFGSGPAANCSNPLKIDTGIITTGFGYSGQASFWVVIEYAFNEGEWNTPLEEFMFKHSPAPLGYTGGGWPGNPNGTGLWGLGNYSGGQIGTCYDVATDSGYAYHRGKVLNDPTGGSWAVDTVQEIIDVVMSKDPLFTPTTYLALRDALDSYDITCGSGGCTGICRCVCMEDGCLEGEDNDVYQMGCTDDTALNYDPDATFGDIEDLCEYPEDEVITEVYGCMDQEACNYNQYATVSVEEPNCTGNQDFYDCCHYRYTCIPGQGALAGQSFCTIDCDNGEFDSLEECENSGCEEERPYRPRPDDPITDKDEDPIKDIDIEKIICYKCKKGYSTPVAATFNGPDCPPGYSSEIPDCKRESEEIPGCTDPEATNYNFEATIDDLSCEYDIDPYNVGLGPWFCPMDQGNFPWPGCCVQVGAPSVAAGFLQYPDDYENANGQAMPNYVINATWPNNDGLNYWSSAPGNAVLFSNSLACNESTGCAYNMQNPLTGANCGGFVSDYDYDPPEDGENLPTIDEPPTPLKQRLQELAGIKKKK